MTTAATYVPACLGSFFNLGCDFPFFLWLFLLPLFPLPPCLPPSPLLSPHCLPLLCLLPPGFVRGICVLRSLSGWGSCRGCVCIRLSVGPFGHYAFLVRASGPARPSPASPSLSRHWALVLLAGDQRVLAPARLGVCSVGRGSRAWGLCWWVAGCFRVVTGLCLLPCLPYLSLLSCHAF